MVFITAIPDGRHEDEKFILNAMDEFSEGTGFITGMPDERHEYEMFILNAMDEFSEGTG